MAEIVSVPPPPPVQPGELVAGKYLVQRAVAEGGMGIVFAAKHTELDQEVALKVMRSELRGRISTKRFTLEARATAKLKSPHVARVFDVGVLDSGTPFMVMELLDGQDLDSIVQEEGRLQPVVAADLMVQACEAIAEAHEAGIIHRDLKPANLFVTRTKQGAPFVKVLDFGISKATIDGTSAGGTAAGTIMGSPPYMSPEQLRSSHNADARSDIWSLGVILYELVTGALPFDGEGVGDIALKVHHEDPKWPRELVPTIPEEFERVIRRCLDRERDKRYANVAELQEDLLAFLTAFAVPGAPISIRSSQPRVVFPRERVVTPQDPPPETIAREAVPAPVTSDPGPPPRTNLQKAIVVGALAIGLAGVAFAIGSGRRTPTVATANASTVATIATVAAPPEPHATPRPPEPEASATAATVTASAAPAPAPPPPPVADTAKPKPVPVAAAKAIATAHAVASSSAPVPPAPPPTTQLQAPATTAHAVRDRGF